MPDETRPAMPPPTWSDAASVASAPVPERATPRDPRRWFSDAYVPDPALVARGETHVRVGAAVMVVALVGVGVAVAGLSGLADATRGSTPLAKALGAVVWQSLIALGILASSRVARGIAVAQAALTLPSALGVTVMALRFGGFGTPMGRMLLAIAACMVLTVAGTALATISPAARAWHAAQQAARGVRRKAKSLADWRQPER